MKRILIVDDIDENLELLRILLEGHGYEVEQASNGSEAIAKALEKVPDMIVSDILMPIMDGFTLCGKWKADERLKRAPFIFYTATYTDPLDEQLAINMGADAFIVKPMARDEFMRRIETILNSNKERMPASPQEPKATDESILKNYNEALIRKLEKKMLELERVNRELETEIAAKNKIEAALRESEGLVRATLSALLSPEGDIGTLQLGDILDVQATQSIMNSFFDLTGIGVAVLDLNGKVLVATGWQDICTKYHRVHPETREYCVESDTKLSAGVEPGTCKIYKCKNNMLNIVMPIIVGGNHIGNLFLGQFFFDDDLPDYEVFRAQARHYGFDEGEYLAALERVPRWSRKRIEDIMSFYIQFASLTSTLSYSNIKLARSLTERKQVEEALLRKNDELVQAATQLDQMLKNQDRARLVLLSILEDERIARQVLRKSEEKYRLISENITDTVWLMDMDFHATYISPSLEKARGYTLEEIRNMPLERQMTPESLKMAEAVIAEALTPENLAQNDMAISRTMSLEFYRKDGSTFWSEITMSVLRGPDGAPTGFMGSGRDITERKKAEDNLKKSEAALIKAQSVAHLGSWVWLIKENSVECSDEMFRIFGVDKAGFTGDLAGVIATAIHPDDREAVNRTNLSVARDKKSAPLEYRVVKPDGSMRWVYAEAGELVLDEKGEAVMLTGIVLDITERRRAEEELRKFTEKLEQLVIERTAELERANRELESFSYTVSHDLRAPLRHINGFLEMFRREMGDVANEKARHYMDVINDSTARMGTLIDDLLSFSRMGKTELAIKTVDMGALADEALKEFQEEIARQLITVSRGALPPATGDRAMLRVVLANLVSNAVKFSSKTGNPRIEIACEIKDGEQVYSVRDNGAGFDMRYADKLFGVFQRLHAEKDFEGTGIGLATIKRILQRHGGRVWAEGEVGRGACFYFTLPAEKETAPDVGQKIHQPNGNGDKEI